MAWISYSELRFMSRVDFDTAEMTEETKLLPTEEAEGTAGVEAEVHLNVKTIGMEVSFEIIKVEDEVDGEEVMTHFCRHERFIDWVPILNELDSLTGGYVNAIKLTERCL